MSPEDARREAKNLPGIKRKDMQPCAFGHGVANSGIMMFYRAKIDTAVLDVTAIAQTSGLEQMMGGGEQGAALSIIMGPNPDLAKVLEGRTVFVCLDCAMHRSFAEVMEASAKGDGG